MWRKQPFRYQGQMTTQEYNQFATFRGKMLKETDTEKAEDMATRLYEYGAMKFLDMSHDTYLRAEKDEVRMAVDACLHISSWNGHITTAIAPSIMSKHIPVVGVKSDGDSPYSL